MKIQLHRFELPLKHEFTIARGSRTFQRSLVVELQQGAVSGYGEATENSYYGHTLDSIAGAIESCRSLIERDDYESPAALWNALRSPLSGDMFTMSAIDLAAHDLFGKISGLATYELLGLQWDAVPDSSYTIGIDSIDEMVRKLEEQPDWPIYKIKLGTQHDVHIVRALRQNTNAVFRVDANCGWSAEETINNSKQLVELGVEFIEQPLPTDAPDLEQQKVFRESALPIIADEACQRESDVDACHGRFHGVNIKLCKCGGLTPAVRMLRHARQLQMKTMIGCMLESTVGISGASQLLPLLDYADLDGAALLARDIATGVKIQNGVVGLAQGPGSGIELISPSA